MAQKLLGKPVKRLSGIMTMKIILNENQGIAIQCVTNGDDFDKREQTFAGFVFADKRLRRSEPFGQFNLRKPAGDTAILQELAQAFFVLGVAVPSHAAYHRLGLTLIPNRDIVSAMKHAADTALDLFDGTEYRAISPFKTQLLKWIGNKQRFAHEICSFFPTDIRTYYEPFLGSGAVLATLQPPKALGSDAFGPLIEIWQCLQRDPKRLAGWYAERYVEYHALGKPEGYERIKARYNARPNGADLLFVCRSCYGGVVRFRKSDGYISTPCGVHDPITPESFAQRIQIWRRRTSGAIFENLDFAEAMNRAKRNDFVYCDPPYVFSQAILYQGQDFSLARLIEAIGAC
jgi:DNA adenine methylase